MARLMLEGCLNSLINAFLSDGIPMFRNLAFLPDPPLDPRFERVHISLFQPRCDPIFYRYYSAFDSLCLISLQTYIFFIIALYTMD
jgi:hypothetical protein